MSSDEWTHTELVDAAEELLSEDLAETLAADDGTTGAPPPGGHR